MHVTVFIEFSMKCETLVAVLIFMYLCSLPFTHRSVIFEMSQDTQGVIMNNQESNVPVSQIYMITGRSNVRKGNVQSLSTLN